MVLVVGTGVSVVNSEVISRRCLSSWVSVVNSEVGSSVTDVTLVDPAVLVGDTDVDWKMKQFFISIA